jgi:hypothetical protein
MRDRVRTAAPVLAVWLVAGAALAQATGRVKDWFAMSDELYYERLAISIARTGSPLPRVDGVRVPNVDQLLPLLLAPFYRGALVPAALHHAHVFDAFVMTSAVVPAYLLARRAVGRRWLALGAAALSVAVPWLVYADLLLTEVVAYPAFLWAVLAIERAVGEPRLRNDALALGGIALATFARTQLLALAAVLPLAVLVRWAATRRRPSHPLLVGVYAAAAVGAVLLAATGGLARALGTYQAAGHGDLLPPHYWRGVCEHLAAVALAVGIVPFLVGGGWALARLARSAFAAVALAACVVLALEVTSFDLRYTGPAVNDRYLFYLVPLVLVAFAAALVDPPWPRWTIVPPLAVVAAGFWGLQLPTYEKLNVDRPLALVYEHLVGFAGSQRTAQLGLVVVAVVLALLVVEAALLLPRRVVAPVLAAVAVVALPAQTAAAFDRFFGHDGTSGRPLTLDQGVVFDWIDRAVGPGSQVAMVPYPVVPGDYWAGTAFWWDAAFWNRSVTRDVLHGGAFYVTSTSFPKLDLRIDARTGATNLAGVPLVAQAQSDARFRIAGATAASARGVDVVRAVRPWRVSWLTRGLYPDGWTHGTRPATVRVFPAPGQRAPRTRYLDLRVSAAVASVPYRVVTPTGTIAATAGADTRDTRLDLCVPARGFAEVSIRAGAAASLYGVPLNSVEVGRQREVGVHLVQVALADEVGPTC